MRNRVGLVLEYIRRSHMCLFECTNTDEKRAVSTEQQLIEHTPQFVRVVKSFSPLSSTYAVSTSHARFFLCSTSDTPMYMCNRVYWTCRMPHRRVQHRLRASGHSIFKIDPINEFSKFAEHLSTRHNFVLYLALVEFGHAQMIPPQHAYASEHTASRLA